MNEHVSRSKRIGPSSHVHRCDNCQAFSSLTTDLRSVCCAVYAHSSSSSVLDNFTGNTTKLHTIMTTAGCCSRIACMLSGDTREAALQSHHLDGQDLSRQGLRPSARTRRGAQRRQQTSGRTHGGEGSETLPRPATSSFSSALDGA